MKSLRLLTAGVAMAAALGAMAQAEEPIITFHSNIYDTYGATNRFHIVLGATEPTYVDIDYGYGPIEEEIMQADFDSDAGSMTGTAISMSVSQEGIVKIYGDASKIDYVEMEGCYISDISFPTLTEVRILNLQHNELKSLDLTHMTKLQALYLDDNPFSEQSPLVIGGPKPELAILEMNMVDWLSPQFDLTQYPDLRVLSAYSCPSLATIDPTGCPKLLQLTIDGSAVSQLDLSANPYLLVLNISETKIKSIDLSHNPLLTEFYCQHIATHNQQYKIDQLDLSHNPELVRLYVDGNNLEYLDLSNNLKLMSFGCKRNHISSLSFEGMEKITLIDISENDMGYANMPVPKPTYSEYYYWQNPVAMHRSYAEGTTFDFSGTMVRDDSETVAALFAYTRENPAEPVQLDDEYFTWNADGHFAVNKAYGDSVYVAFHNSAFPEYDLRTANFRVKSAEEMGERLKAVSLTMSSIVKQEPLNFYVGIDGATDAAPAVFYVDCGDGTPVECTATTSSIPAEPNVTAICKGTKVIIYTDENVDLTALKFDDRRLNGPVDVSNAAMLRELEITNSNLRAIDLQWNRCLTRINLSGNALTSLNLKEPNAHYTKTALTDINLSDNKLSQFLITDPWGFRRLNLANNQLTEVVTEHGVNLVELNVSGNLIEEILLNDLESVEVLDLSNNRLSELLVPTYLPLKKFDVSGNRFSMPDLPLPGVCADYTYAPQQPIEVASKAPSINLSYQFMTVDGTDTQYEWRYADDDTAVPAGNISTKGDGRFKFDNPDTGNIYCAISHPAYPQFAGENVLRTTVVTTALPPANEFASFTTTDGGTIGMSLAANKNHTVIYIDWSGEGDFEQYDLMSQYILYKGEAAPGANVKLYSYDENDGVTVLSLSNASMSAIDVSAMKSLTTLGISGSPVELENLKLPADGQIKEFIADGCGFTALPSEGLSGVTMLVVNRNPLGRVDISSLKALEGFYAEGCDLTEVTFDNPSLWNLYLGKNKLEQIDLSKLPALQQLFIIGNNLDQIDLSANNNLKVLSIEGNRFDMQSLPVPSSRFLVYNYSSQQPIEIEVEGATVDLSRQAQRDGVATSYTWYIDTPYFDDYGELIGEDLYVDEEYLLEGGVTTFLKTFKNVMCVMTNDLFPGLYLYTTFVDITVAGVEDVEIDATDAEYYNLQGVRVDNPGAGIYIRRQGNVVSKVMRR